MSCFVFFLCSWFRPCADTADAPAHMLDNAVEDVANGVS